MVGWWGRRGGVSQFLPLGGGRLSSSRSLGGQRSKIRGQEKSRSKMCWVTFINSLNWSLPPLCFLQSMNRYIYTNTTRMHG